MSDLVPDKPRPETYKGPYGEFPAPQSKSQARRMAVQAEDFRAKAERLEVILRSVRAANESLRIERAGVEQILGVYVPTGGLPGAVEKAVEGSDGSD